VLAVDPSAKIAPTAVIGADVSIGPYCVIGPNVAIGDGCRLVGHVHIAGRTTIGPRTVIHPFASLGGPPQSVHYHGEDTALTIGADCDIREHVTINIGTVKGRGVTTVGDHCFMMTGAHVGHDCVVGNHVTFANNATLGGFCEIGDYVFLGGLCAVHQFVRVGERVMVGGLVGVTQDVIPYTIVIGHRGELAGLNRVGLRRGGFSAEQIHALYRAYKALFFGPGTLAERVKAVAEAYAGDPRVMRVVEFIRSGKTRRLTTPRSAAERDE
jgi:UDP-N-acetylglucosamine acyltransferase